MLRLLFAGPLLMAWIALSVSCSTEDEERVDSPTISPSVAQATDAKAIATPTASREIVVMGDADWPIWLGDSVKTLTEGYDVVTGRVTGIALPFDPRPGYGGVPPETPPADHPKSSYIPSKEEINRPPGRLFTVFSVEVIDPGSTKLSSGETINVGQSAGIWEGKQYQMAGNPPLEIGQEYIMTISPSETVTKLAGGAGYFMGHPFGHFVVDSDGVRPFDAMWGDLPAVRELSGKSADAAMRTILTARVQAKEEATPAR